MGTNVREKKVAGDRAMPERIKEAGVEEVVKANGAAAVNGSNGDRPANRAAPADDDAAETKEWLDALDSLIQARGEERARYILTELKNRANVSGVHVPFTANTPYINTIPVAKQPLFPGNRDIERRIKSLVRWNAMAMVVRANKKDGTLGGHISTFASSATLYEVGFNHFFHGPDHPDGADQIYFQGHASPGIYARAFLEGRLGEEKLHHFRQELAAGGGLSSYPHPWLMPDFWQFPTVSMGLGPIMAIYQARFNRYLEHRGLAKTAGQHVWCFMGDGECDEPESLGALTLASREGLDNLIFVINCNLQRLDGPVRGNGKIIQELEAAFRGAGWNVHQGHLGRRLGPAAGARQDRPARPAHGRSRRRRVSEIHRRRRRLHPRALLRQVSRAARAGRAPVRRAAGQAEARRPRPGEGLCRLQGGRGAQGPADRHPGADRQGLRPGRGRRRQEHRPSEEEARTTSS